MNTTNKSSPAAAANKVKLSTCRELAIYKPKLSNVLDEVRRTIGQYVYAPTAALDIATLWVAMTWIAADCLTLPLAVIQSPVPASGKSTLLDVMSRMSYNSINGISITAAVLFSMPEPPTLFIDEADTFFGNKDELSGIVNAGHTRANASVLRASVGEDGRQVSSFNVFYPKAISQLGNVLSPATLSRAVIIRMAAKPENIKLRKLLFAPWQFREVQAALKDSLENIRPHFFKSQIAASKALEQIGLSNREADNYIPLYAIASAASGEWAARCLFAARALVEPAKSLSTGQEILTNIQAIMPSLGTHTDKTTGETTPVQVIGSNDLLTQLLFKDDFGWNEYNNGRPLTVRLLAQLLKPFGVTPDLHRPKGSAPKRGYSIAQLEMAISQYLPSSVPSPAPTPTPTPKKHRTTQHRKATKPAKAISINIAGGIPIAKAAKEAEQQNDTAFDAAVAHERLEMEYKRNKKNKEAALREKNNQPPPPPTSVPIPVFDDFEDIPF